MLNQLKLLLGDTEAENDELLSLLLSRAEQSILTYTRRNVLLPELKYIAVSLALAAYNRMGAEGQKSRTEGGVSRTFEVDIPAEVKTQLNRYIKARVI